MAYCICWGYDHQTDGKQPVWKPWRVALAGMGIADPTSPSIDDDRSTSQRADNAAKAANAKPKRSFKICSVCFAAKGSETALRDAIEELIEESEGRRKWRGAARFQQIQPACERPEDGRADRL